MQKNMRGFGQLQYDFAPFRGTHIDGQALFVAIGKICTMRLTANIAPVDPFDLDHLRSHIGQHLR
jgi:hypothetical protein